MTTIANRGDTLVPEPTYILRTAAAQDDSLAIPQDQRKRDEWQRVIDQKLIEWGCDPAQLAEDDLIPPTGEAVRVASLLAMQLRDQNAPPPNRIIPDRDGGIAMERWEGDAMITIMVSSSGTVEILHWAGSTIVSSHQLR